MAYGIIKQHSGFIQVEPMPDKGICFSIILPVAEVGVAVQLSTNSPGIDFQGTGTIMVVEDNKIVRELACNILQKFGYAVMAASCAQECISMLSGFQGKLELVLTDVVMPDMNGRELFENLKAQNRGVKVLFMSGYTDQIIDRHGILEDGFHFIQKPFSVEALADKVRSVLGG
jgi:CheY-like chemotaxis protein